MQDRFLGAILLITPFLSFILMFYQKKTIIQVKSHLQQALDPGGEVDYQSTTGLETWMKTQEGQHGEGRGVYVFFFLKMMRFNVSMFVEFSLVPLSILLKR